MISINGERLSARRAKAKYPALSQGYLCGLPDGYSGTLAEMMRESEQFTAAGNARQKAGNKRVRGQIERLMARGGA